MFDIAWSELMVIAVVALVVIGPKDLPKAIFTLGKWVRKARVVAREFQGHIDDMMREAELDELRREALKVRDANLKSMVENTVDPKGDLKNAFDVGFSGHPGSPPEEEPAPVGSPQVAAAQPQPATEPPVTAPPPPAAPVEFTPTPAAAEPVPVQTTNKQA
ncbi:Sec-independent protein translocase protein TatB [Azospirillum sp. sgz302134]